MQLLESGRATLALALKRREAAKRADPLAYFKFSSDSQRKLVRHCHDSEVYFRAGNKSGKTYVGAALGVALARGVRVLDGEKVPALKTPNVGWLIVQAYKQSQDSAVKAYRQLIGEWPHKVIKGPNGDVVQFRIKPNNCDSDNTDDWSIIRLFVDDGQEPAGGQIDWAHMDEPCSQLVWHEVRFRWQAGRPFIRIITATPLKMSKCRWIMEEFAGCLNRVVNQRIELVCSIYDNKALTKEDIQRAEIDAEADDYGKARLMGEYVDTEGDSPFGPHGYSVLHSWKSRCWEGQGEAVSIISQAPDGSTAGIEVEYEKFYRPERNEQYYIVFDLTGGMQHPACGHVYALRTPRLVARYGAKVGIQRSGVLEPFACGYLAAQMQKQYPGLADFESNAGYGHSFMRGFREAGGRKVNRDVKIDKPNTKPQERYGFNTDKFSRARWIGSCQEIIAADAVRIPSLDAVECLIALRLDKNDRIVDEEHRHAEDMICLGRFADYYLSVGSKIRRVDPPAKPRVEQINDWLESKAGVRFESPSPQMAEPDFGT